MSTTKVVLLSVLALVVLLSLGWGIRYYMLQQQKHFAPKEENVRRTVFEETKSFVHGKNQELSKLYGEHQRADSATRIIIENQIAVQFAAFDTSKVQTAALKTFLIDARGF